MRAWTDADLAPRIRERMDEQGWGLWATERKDSEFVGVAHRDRWAGGDEKLT